MSSGAPPIRRFYIFFASLQLNEAVRRRVMGHGSSMEEKSVTADIVSRRSVNIIIHFLLLPASSVDFIPYHCLVLTMPATHGRLYY